MGISQEVSNKSEIRPQSMLWLAKLYLQSTGRGKMKGLCPFHQEDTPSFTVDTTDNLYYCFGCQEGGDVFNFVQKHVV